MCKLTDEEMRFCQAYEEMGYNQVKAVQSVWPDLTYQSAAVKANRLLKSDKIKEYIEEHRGQIEKNLGISKQKMVNLLLKQIYDENVMPRDKTAAMTLLGKMMGYSEDKVKVSGDVNVQGGFTFAISSTTAEAFGKLKDDEGE